MGTASSIPSQERMSKFLIGNLKNKSPMELKFYGLSHLFLENLLNTSSDKILVSSGNETSCGIELGIDENMTCDELDSDDQTLNTTGKLDSVDQTLNTTGKLDSVDQTLNTTGKLDSVDQTLNTTGKLDSVDQTLNTTSKLDSVDQTINTTSKLDSVDQTINTTGSGNGATYSPFEDSHENRNYSECSNLLSHNDPGLFVPLKSTKRLFSTQTYIQWKSSYDIENLRNIFSKSKRIIYLVPLNDFPSFIDEFKICAQSTNINLHELITKFLEAFFCGMNVQWLPLIDISESKWTIKGRYHHKTNKFQYLVTDFFVPLQNRKPKNGYCIMGMSWIDLYPKEELNFVLGEASNQHKSGVFSFGRFEPKTFSESHPDITEIHTNVLWKLLKVASHELCHLFGLSHCEYFLCSMNQSSSISEALSQPLFLCPVCIRKLQHVCKFDILDRYNRLQTIIDCIQSQMPSQKWKESCDWLNRCRHFLIGDIALNKQIEVSTSL